MTSSNRKRTAGWRLLRGRRASAAQGIVEFAFTLPFLLIFSAVIFEFGRAVLLRQQALSLVREGGFLATRKTDPPTATNFPNVIAAMEKHALPLSLASRGRVYVAQVFPEQPGNKPRIVQFQQHGALAKASPTVAAGLNGLATLPGTVTLHSNTPIYVVEVFLRHDQVFPFGFGTFQIATNMDHAYDIGFF